MLCLVSHTHLTPFFIPHILFLTQILTRVKADPEQLPRTKVCNIYTKLWKCSHRVLACWLTLHNLSLPRTLVWMWTV